MAQSGFAFFFLTVLIGCTIALLRWVQLNWAKIATAARGDAPDVSRPLNYRAVQRRPIDVPYVAQRMLAEPALASRRRSGARPAWAPRPSRPSASQLAFGF